MVCSGQWPWAMRNVPCALGSRYAVRSAQRLLNGLYRDNITTVDESSRRPFNFESLPKSYSPCFLRRVTASCSRVNRGARGVSLACQKT